MKFFVIVLIFQFIASVYAQPSHFFNDKGQLISDTALSIPDPNSYPVMEGGEEKMITLLLDKIKYPDIAAENDIEGIAIVGLIFNPNGDIAEITFLKKPNIILKKSIDNCLEILYDIKFNIPNEANSKLYLTFVFRLTESDAKKYFENGSLIICRKRYPVIIDQVIVH